MPEEYLAGRQDPLAHGRLPGGSFGWPADLADGVVDLPRDDIDDAFQDVFLPGHVVVQRHRLGPEFVRQAPHRDGLDAALVGDLDRGSEHPIPAQRDPGSRCRLGLGGHLRQPFSRG